MIRNLLILTCLAIAATACGNTSNSSSPNQSTTTAAKRSTTAFTSCLKNHGVTLPGGGGFPQGGQPPNGAQPPSNGQPPSGTGSGGPEIPAKFRKAIKACASLAPQGNGPPNGAFGGG